MMTLRRISAIHTGADAVANVTMHFQMQTYMKSRLPVMLWIQFLRQTDVRRPAAANASKRNSNVCTSQHHTELCCFLIVCPDLSRLTSHLPLPQIWHAFRVVRQVYAMARKRGRSVYTLAGKRVCKRFFLKQMGVGRKVWAKCRTRAREGHEDPPIDLRTLRTGPRNRPAADSANRFFRWLYDSEAETLPDFPDVSKEPDTSGEERLPSDSESDGDAREVRSAGAKRPKIFDLGGFMVEDKFLDPAEPESAPQHEIRWISHTSLRFLYRQYRLWCGAGQRAAALGTFWSTYRASWAAVLRSRKPGQHAKCDSCEQLKAAVRSAKLRSDARAFQADYDQRQREQFADRRTYYSARNVSENFFSCLALSGYTSSARCPKTSNQTSGSVFCCLLGILGPAMFPRDTSDAMLASSAACLIIDGMDQAKFRIPRSAPGPTSFIEHPMSKPPNQSHSVNATDSDVSLAGIYPPQSASKTWNVRPCILRVV